jgi:hypothetical protein
MRVLQVQNSKMLTRAKRKAGIRRAARDLAFQLGLKQFGYTLWEEPCHALVRSGQYSYE